MLLYTFIQSYDLCIIKNNFKLLVYVVIAHCKYANQRHCNFNFEQRSNNSNNVHANEIYDLSKDVIIEGRERMMHSIENVAILMPTKNENVKW